MKEIHLKVYGRVQGVFFRQSCVARANELGVLGWVKNCSDGTVEALCQGDQDQIERMLDWLSLGPQNAYVETVRVLFEKDCTKRLEGFNIIYEESI